MTGFAFVAFVLAVVLFFGLWTSVRRQRPSALLAVLVTVASAAYIFA
jgi:hypothetical protein